MRNNSTNSAAISKSVHKMRWLASCVSKAGGWNKCSLGDTNMLHFFPVCCMFCYAVWNSWQRCYESFGQLMATDTFHLSALPAFHGVNIRVSGLPSVLNRSLTIIESRTYPLALWWPVCWRSLLHEELSLWDSGGENFNESEFTWLAVRTHGINHQGAIWLRMSDAEVDVQSKSCLGEE